MKYFGTQGARGSFFSAPDDGIGGGTAAIATQAAETEDPAKQEQENPLKYSEADITKLKAEFEKTSQAAVKTAVADALAKAQLSPEDLAKTEADERRAANDAKEKELAARELRIDALTKLAEKNYPAEFIDFVVGADAEETAKRIEQLHAIVAKQAKALVQETIKGKTPAGGGDRGAQTTASGRSFLDIIHENQATRK
jgi:hypothetical protein